MAEHDERSEQEIKELIEEAMRRFEFDPVFHARAHLAISMTAASSRFGRGTDLSKEEQTTTLISAIVALVLAERDPVTMEKARAD